VRTTALEELEAARAALQKAVDARREAVAAHKAARIAKMAEIPPEIAAELTREKTPEEKFAEISAGLIKALKALGWVPPA